MRAIKFNFDAIAQTDWARMASMLDGEGYIGIAKVKRNPSDTYWLRIRVHNTDNRMPDWCESIFGGHVHTALRSGRHLSAYIWETSNAHAEAILRGCLPYFIIKREQAEVALAFRRTFGVGSRMGVYNEKSQLHHPQVKPEVLVQREDLQQQLKGLYCRVGNFVQ